MLSTPPAFILSQDQTLMFNLSLNINVSFFRRDLLRLYCFRFVFSDLFSFILFKNFRDCITVYLSRFRVVVFTTAWLYYHNHLSLSTTFLFFFFHLTVFATALIEYHVVSLLSTTFPKNFLLPLLPRRLTTVCCFLFFSVASCDFAIITKLPYFGKYFFTFLLFFYKYILRISKSKALY